MKEKMSHLNGQKVWVCTESGFAGGLKRRLRGLQELSVTKAGGQGHVRGSFPWGVERAGGPLEVLGGHSISHGSWDGAGRQAISVRY